MCCDPFWSGVALGMAAGTCLGIRLKAKEKKIRRTLHKAGRTMETAFDSMSH